MDVEDGIKVKAELGFGISDAPGRQRRGSSWDEAYYTNPTGGGIVSRRGCQNEAFPPATKIYYKKKDQKAVVSMK